MYVNQLAALLPAPAGVPFSTVGLGAYQSCLAKPTTVSEGRVLFYMHGGGYVHGGVDTYRILGGHLALKLGARVYMPDYRQAPEHPFPAPIDDFFTAYRALLNAGTDPNRIVLAINNDWRADLPTPRPSRYAWAVEARLDSGADSYRGRSSR